MGLGVGGENRCVWMDRKSPKAFSFSSESDLMGKPSTPHHHAPVPLCVPVHDRESNGVGGVGGVARLGTTEGHVPERS